MMRLKNFALALLAATVTTASAYAGTISTLTYQNSTGAVVGGVYVYPYNLSLNNSTTTTSMMCINYNDTITTGETWQVTSQILSSSSALALKEDAWLFSQVGKGTYSNADIQFAVWDILYAGTSNNVGFDSVAKSLVTMAQNAASGLSDSFLSQYTTYSPVSTASAQATWTEGLPQSFIAATDPSAVTPEPSSMVLLTTGLAGACALLLRRQQQA